MGTVHINEHELILITTTMDFACHVLADSGMDQSVLAEIEDLRRRLHLEWEDESELHPDARIPDCIYAPDPEDFQEGCSHD